MSGRPPTIREEVLLDAARDVFRELGHAATTAEVARRARVSEGILFYRYKTKEALLAAVIRRETQPPEALRRVAEDAGRHTLARNLKLIVEAVLDAVVRVHPLMELVETSPTSLEIRRVLTSGRPPPEEVVELITGYLEGEMRLGRVRRIDAVPVARAVMGGCIDFVRSQHLAGVAGDRRAFVRGLVDLLHRGTTND